MSEIVKTQAPNAYYGRTASPLPLKASFIGSLKWKRFLQDWVGWLDQAAIVYDKEREA